MPRGKEKKKESAEEKIRRAKDERPKVRGARYAKTPLGSSKTEKEERKLHKKSDRQKIKQRLRKIKSFKDYLEEDENH